MVTYYDNKAAMYITNNFVFHKRMKHVEVDYHFIQDIVMVKWILTSYYVTFGAKLGDIFTKALFQKSYSTLCIKLGMIDIYASA